MPRPLPSMRHLRVFESAARLGSFRAAASELHTTQSSISRAVSDLERSLGTKLFERVHRGVRLTLSGKQYQETVAGCLDRIAEVGEALAKTQETLVVATGHSIAMQFLMPLRKELSSALGLTHTQIHVLITDYDLLDRLARHDAHVVLSYEPGGGPPEDRAVAFRQAVRPVCSPGYAAEHPQVLDWPIEKWSDLSILEGIRPSRGWVTWQDWFEFAGRPGSRPRRLNYFDYMFLLEDALAGKGLALGWRRLIDRHLETGALIAAGDGFVELREPCYAELTESGRHRQSARRCLEFFDDLTRRVDGA